MDREGRVRRAQGRDVNVERECHDCSSHYCCGQPLRRMPAVVVGDSVVYRGGGRRLSPRERFLYLVGLLRTVRVG